MTTSSLVASASSGAPSNEKLSFPANASCDIGHGANSPARKRKRISDALNAIMRIKKMRIYQLSRRE